MEEVSIDSQGAQRSVVLEKMKNLKAIPLERWIRFI